MRFSAAILAAFTLTVFAGERTAENSFSIALPPAKWSTNLLADSPFGINTAFEPDTKDLLPRLKAMQQAGIKWARQDFTWKKIETAPGVYDWSGYDRLVEECREHGILLAGDFAYGPSFHDPRTEAGAQAYARLAAEGARRYAGKVDYWQIWNEPNGGFWKGSPDEYARLLQLAGKAIHQANPHAKVLGLNMAFCDVLWAEKIMAAVPNNTFDIACFHPYRPPNAPEDKFDWWLLDHYVKRWHKGDLTPEFPLVRMSYIEQAAELKKVTEKFGAAKPLWVTEMCWNTHIHPYGTPELRQADLLVRFYVLSLASQLVDKVFWWTLKDGNSRQFDQADMVGLMRNDLQPKYSYYAYAWMTRLLEDKKWVRNELFGPDAYACTFAEPESSEQIIVAWATKPFAYFRISNTAAGLTFYDVFGTKRFVPLDEVRTKNLPVPLGESPIYIVTPRGARVTLRPDPGW